jgi:hypothetical protein
LWLQAAVEEKQAVRSAAAAAQAVTFHLHIQFQGVLATQSQLAVVVLLTVFMVVEHLILGNLAQTLLLLQLLQLVVATVEEVQTLAVIMLVALAVRVAVVVVDLWEVLLLVVLEHQGKETMVQVGVATIKAVVVVLTLLAALTTVVVAKRFQ